MNREKLKNILGSVFYKARFKQQKKAYKLIQKQMLKYSRIDQSLFTKEVIEQYKEKWGVLDKNVDISYFLLYSSNNGEVDLNYVPDYLNDIPIGYLLNNRRSSHFYSDKIFLDDRYKELESLLPDTLFRKINGVYYDSNYNYISDIQKYIIKLDEENLLVKPSIDSAGGDGIEIFQKNEIRGNYSNPMIEDLYKWMHGKNDLIAQKVAKQSEFYSSLNSSSVNTIRAATYRSVIDEAIHNLPSVVRIGGSGAMVDNWHAGGKIVGVDEKGLFKSEAYDMRFRKSKFDKAGLAVPHLKNIQETAKRLAKQYFQHRILNFDFYIDDSERVGLLEVNTSLAPRTQMYSAPLYGDLTDEIIDYCRTAKGSQVITLPIYIKMRK